MQLTTYTNAVGTAQAIKGTSHPFSPYIKAIAPLPVGTNKDGTAILAESKTSETTPDGTSMGGSGGRELARG